MFLTSLVIACALAALLFFAIAMSRWRRGRLVVGTLSLFLSALLGFAAVCVGFLGGTLMTYERLTHEQPALQIEMKKVGERHFKAKLTYPSTLAQEFELLGDEWQVDARLLKWTGLANLLGFDTVYRIERLSGRYTDAAQEKTAPRTVHALAAPDTVDVWDLARRGKQWVPFIDALYGSAVFVPMADGAAYQVVVSQAGVGARPLNDAAKQAVGGWK